MHHPLVSVKPMGEGTRGKPDLLWISVEHAIDPRVKGGVVMAPQNSAMDHKTHRDDACNHDNPSLNDP